MTVNRSVGTTISITRSDGTTEVMTAPNDDPTTANKFSVGGSRTNNDVADNIAVGTGGVLGIHPALTMLKDMVVFFIRLLSLLLIPSLIHLDHTHLL